MLLTFVPEARTPFWNTAAKYALELVTILPAVMVLMGIMTVFVLSDVVGRILGHSSGVRGMVIAFFLGTLPNGPLYVAFPYISICLGKYQIAPGPGGT